jgi:hypothetical protein
MDMETAERLLKVIERHDIMEDMLISLGMRISLAEGW